MSLLLSNFYPKADAVLVTGNQTITGIKTFQNRPTVNGIGVLLQGEATAGGSIENAVYTTGSQTITGPKNFTARPTFNNLNLITTGDLLNLELNIEGALTSSTAFNGNRQIKRLPSLSDPAYGGTTVSGFLENMFFPYINVSLGLNAFTFKTYGFDTITSETFAGTINSTDDSITGISYMWSNTILSGPDVRTTFGNYSKSVNFASFPIIPTIYRTSTSTSDFKTRLYGTRNGVAFTQDSNTQRLRFEPAYYYGVSTNSALGVNITGLTIVNPSTYLNNAGSNYNIGGRPSFINGLQFTFNTTTPNGYIYFAYPDFQSPTESLNNWGPLNSNGGVMDSVTLFDYTAQFVDNGSTQSITLPTRSNLNYRIYRSDLLTPVNLPTTFTLNFKFV